MPKAAQTALRALQRALDKHGVVPPPSDHIPASVPVVTVEQWRQCAIEGGISGQGTTCRAKQKAFKGASRAFDQGRTRQLVGGSGMAHRPALAAGDDLQVDRVANTRTPFKGGVRVRSPYTRE